MTTSAAPTSRAGCIEPYRYQPQPMHARDWWERVTRDERVQPILAALQADLDAAAQRPAHPAATDFLAARRANDRSPLDEYWHARRRTLAGRVVLRAIDGRTEAGIDDALLDLLWAILTCPTWVVSAHLPDNDLPMLAAPQLDLAACETAMSLAETLELLRPWIAAQSSTLAANIVQEIDRRVLQPFVETTPKWCHPAYTWNNWAGVCAGSILAACEALSAVGQPRPEARGKALEVLAAFVHRAFTPAGECDEGMGYWNYGMSFACLGWSRLDPEECRQVVDMARLQQLADYPRQAHLFADVFFSGNDAPWHAQAVLPASAWLAGMTGSAWLADWSCQADARDGDNLRNPAMVLRLLDVLCRPLPERHTLPPVPAARLIADQQAAIFTTDRLMVSLAGGHNLEPHNHNDLGHFNVWVDRQLLVPDLGRPRYSADFFGAKRYTYLAAASRGHCCPLIDGHEQVSAAAAAASVIEVDLAEQRFVLDLAAAYPADAGLIQWQRSLQRTSRGYELTDRFQARGESLIEHVIWSTVEPKQAGDTITLGPLNVRFEPTVAMQVECVDPRAHDLLEFHALLYRLSLPYRTDTAGVLQIRTSLGTD